MRIELETMFLSRWKAQIRPHMTVAPMEFARLISGLWRCKGTLLTDEELQNQACDAGREVKCFLPTAEGL